MAATSVSASLTLPVKLANDGAESGDLTGWTASASVFSAVHDPAGAAEGEWYFEASAPAADYAASLKQRVDLRAYHGFIEDITLDVAMATEGGVTIATGLGRAGILHYAASSTVTLLDVDGAALPYGAGAFIEGDAQVGWVERNTSMRMIEEMHPGLLGQVGYVELSLDGVWVDESGDVLDDSALQSLMITQAPRTVRFDDVRLYVTIPEPGTGALLAASVLIFGCRRKHA